VASVAIASGAMVSVTSQLSRVSGKVEHKLLVENLGVTPSVWTSQGLALRTRQPGFADECEISIFVMVADNMIETGDNLKTSSEPMDQAHKLPE
jgi:hypothetical protein